MVIVGFGEVTENELPLVGAVIETLWGGAAIPVSTPQSDITQPSAKGLRAQIVALVRGPDTVRAWVAVSATSFSPEEQHPHPLGFTPISNAAGKIRRRKVFMSGVVAGYFALFRVRGSALAGVTMVGF